MEVYLYRAEGTKGMVYDFSFNPRVDFEILKKTRKVEKFEVLGLTTIDKAKALIDRIYSNKIIDRIFKIKDNPISSIIQKQTIDSWRKKLTKEYVLPNKMDIEKVEGIIIGKIVLFRELLDFAKQNGVEYGTLLDIIQMLYCERRIQISPAFLENRGRNKCYFCKRKACEQCLFGFKEDDIILYAADNYNYFLQGDYSYKKPSLNLIEEDASLDILKFVRSKKNTGMIFSAPFSFSIKTLLQAFAEVFKKGGRILYITSYSEINEVQNILATTFNKKRVGIANKNFEDYRNCDIVIAYKSNYTRFYKAFDLVVLNDLNNAFEDFKDLTYVVRRAAKDRAKFLLVTANSERYRDSFNEVICIPFAYGNHLISEPRVEISRFLRDYGISIPQMAIDVLKWSIKEDIRTIIFYPDHQRYDELLNNLISNGVNEKLIEYPIYMDDYINILRSNKRVFITNDIKLATQPIGDFNIVVLNCDSDFYNAERLIYISAMASLGKNKRIGEVLFVAEHETEEISLAKKCIRNLNKVSWEKGYVKL